ncbi:hypothetical protein PILCRDRAFT_489302 [Piloderma croceum F 1598]|uniref:Uncharacterized protein n=1 Tax=Piloderma croceum (strain F 1598) TaxID=765440 RepID=A0A0C3FAT4_PILCF|nr:hypothetical protein PILCRDRAFT_747778 [Piloderma croceum F 1598]KIM81765.1 hypothetical protein PILCRDRAFT_489302 [Piloderma croceum F 1598]
MATQSPSLSLLIMPFSQPWWWARSAAPLMAAMSAYARTSLLSGPGGTLHTRGQPSISVNASCLSEFSWMNNGKGQSPCVVAAWEEEPCASSTWNIVALPPGFQYDPPNSTEANPCSCSWATYNLFAACTVCQSSTDFVSWGDWQYNCGEFVSDTTYFPSDKNFTLPSETSIPFWAGTNHVERCHF